MRKGRPHILKSHGGTEVFSKRKLFNSLTRSGLDTRQSKLITNIVSNQVQEGSRTKDIFDKTYKLVQLNSPYIAAHYSLKRAILDLGPTGHHFEKFVAKYYDRLGYETATCRMMTGKFVSHEVDVVASKGDQRTLIECKFHNRVGIKNDIKVALYVKARWDDLRLGNGGNDITSFAIASNTAFSKDALTYAKGVGLKLLGVNSPEENSFLDQIKDLKLFPVTSLRTINKMIKIELLELNVILASDLRSKTSLLQKLGMKEFQIESVLREISTLLGEVK